MQNEYKQCYQCKKYFPATSEYFYITNNGKLHSYCKKCAIEKQKRKQDENPEYYREYHHNRYFEFLKYDDHYMNGIYNYQKKHKKEYQEMQSNWRRNNKEKLKEYEGKRLQHKKHNISKEEWNLCKEFFNFCCAYCGITEQKSKELYGQGFHKDHAINDGSNEIDNCVPCCKSWNTKKHKNDWFDWYNDSLPFFSVKRFNVISEWLNGFTG